MTPLEKFLIDFKNVIATAVTNDRAFMISEENNEFVEFNLTKITTSFLNSITNEDFKVNFDKCLYFIINHKPILSKEKQEIYNQYKDLL